MRQDSKAGVLRCDCGRWNLEVCRVERKWDDVEVVATEIPRFGGGIVSRLTVEKCLFRVSL